MADNRKNPDKSSKKLAAKRHEGEGGRNQIEGVNSDRGKPFGRSRRRKKEKRTMRALWASQIPRKVQGEEGRRRRKAGRTKEQESRLDQNMTQPDD